MVNAAASKMGRLCGAGRGCCDRSSGLFEVEPPVESVMPALATDNVRSRTLLLGGVAVVALIAGTLILWSYYGTAVFFEMVRSGWAACF
jgi:hypothetical protein